MSCDKVAVIMLANMQALHQAALNLNLKIKVLDRDGNVAQVAGALFAHLAVPLNTATVARIMNDKAYTDQVVGDYVRMPKTKDYFNFNSPEQWEKYKNFKTTSEIIQDVEQEFRYPVVVKPNRSSQGRGVTLVQNRAELEQALELIISPDSLLYDYIVLVQEYLPPKREWRVIMVEGELELIYEKQFKDAVYEGNLSPLHHVGAKAVLEHDPNLIAAIRVFLEPLYQALPMFSYGGYDVAELADGSYVLYEINGTPAFEIFKRDNGLEALTKLYEKILRKISNNNLKCLQKRKS